MQWAQTNTRTIDLGYEQLLTFVGQPGTRVRVLYGAMWLTEEGRAQDIFASCGDEVTLGTGGRSVIEGLGAARVQVIEPRGRSLLRVVGNRLRSAWARLRSRSGTREALARAALVVLAIAVSVTVLHVAAPRALGTSQAAAVLQDVANARIGFLALN